jgi:hypothetical protein
MGEDFEVPFYYEIQMSIEELRQQKISFSKEDLTVFFNNFSN